jgi:uncharacterized membrane protein
VLPGAALLHAESIGESRLPPVAAVVTAAALYATMPSRFLAGSGGAITASRIVVPALSLALLWPLALTIPRATRLERSVPRRTAALALIALISVAIAVSIVLLVHILVNGQKVNGHDLLRAAIHMWCTSVLVFALWFWQLDSGGPTARVQRSGAPPDFLFTQQASPELAPEGWQPRFLDYLYLSFTNSTAFSPTDTMPLTRWAKMLMLVEAAASLLLLLTVAARAVNVLQ